MPTENRSSNTEMVSVQRELLERIDRMYTDGMSIFGECEEVRAILAQPAQHQGEPIGYVCPRALEAAINGRIGAEQISILKKPYLYINKPLYTHADPGEVERLRAELRAQDALLEEAYRHDIGTPLKRKIRAQRAALSASAEQSAPECSKCGSLNVDACIANGCWFQQEQSAPVYRDERAEFEALHDKTWPRCEHLHLSHHEYGRKLRWEGWQARAALERKP